MTTPRRRWLGGAGIAVSTLYGVWEELEGLGIVISTRAYGNTRLFKINIEIH
ncbi:MAG: hypothetical protein KAU03_03950 [Candidatus Altiarchaeales archaeon]|nr:hypothetical protein [Candidatus Altiarchaeales archaeon]